MDVSSGKHLKKHAGVAREIALEAVAAVRRGLFAEPALAGELEHQDPGREDRGLATELVYGVLRWKLRLDAIVARCLDRPGSKLQPEVLDILRIALYQLIFLDRVPNHAAVDQAVIQARSHIGGRGPALVNAVLRRFLRDPDALDPLPGPDTRALATYYSHPVWLVQRWIEELGHEKVLDVLSQNNSRALLVVRANRLKTSADELLKLLTDYEVEAQRIFSLPDALMVRPAGHPVSSLPGYREGLFAVQDGASQMVAPLLAPARGERVLDACAAPGGKTAHLAALVNNELELVACDSDPVRLEEMRLNLERLGVGPPRLTCGDASDPNFVRSLGTFDKILLDPPCSNLGVLRHNPEVKYRIRKHDLDALARRQRLLLDAVAPALRPGGLLIYSVCTVTVEETIDVVTSFLNDTPDYTLSPLESTEAPMPEVIDARGFMKTFPAPARLATDGFFVARLQRN